jgi:iron complex outermembrane receptor protein
MISNIIFHRKKTIWNPRRLFGVVNGMYQQNTSTNGTDFIIPSYKQFDIGSFFIVKKASNTRMYPEGLRYDIRSLAVRMYTAPNPLAVLTMPVYGIQQVECR